MNIAEIEIVSGKPEFDYEPIRRLEVKCEATNALMPAPTIEEANGRLRALAAKVGANAIVEVDYNSGISFTSWKSLKATGLAVKRISADTVCPFCAETIKKAAVKCRHCGSDLPHKPEAPIGSTPSVDDPAMHQRVDLAEPLRDNNNPALIIGLVAVGLFIIVLLISAGG